MGEPTTTRGVVAYIMLLRPAQLLMVALGTWIGSRLAGIGDPGQVALMALSTSALFGGSTTLNDWWNVAEDSHNQPHRPLVAGTARRSYALTQAIVLFALAIAAGFAVDSRFGFGGAVATGLSVLYSLRLKSVPLVGNVVVATVSCYSVGCWLLVAEATVEYLGVCAILWLIRMGGELTKTAEDVDGDARAGLVTIATRLGSTLVHRLGLGFLTAAIAMAIVLLAATGAPPLLSIVTGLCGLLVAAGWAISNRPNDAQLIFVERAVTIVFMAGIALNSLAEPVLG